MRKWIVVILLIAVLVQLIRIDLRMGESHNAEINAIEQAEYLDSMYVEHLKQCSFISNEELAVGYDGYIYSKYHQNK